MTNTSFGYYLGARIVTTLGGAMAPIALAFGALDSQGSAVAIGIVLAARSLPALVTLPVGGVLADRISRRGLIFGSSVSLFVLQLVTAVVLQLAGDIAIALLAATQFLFGAVSSLAMPAYGGMIPQLVSTERFLRANATVASAVTLAQGAGLAISGVAVAVAGPDAVITFDAVTFLISGYLILLTGVAGRAAVDRNSYVRDFWEGWRTFVGVPWLWRVVVAAAVSMMAMDAATSVVGPVWADTGSGRATWGVVLASSLAGAAVGSVLVRYIAWRRVLAGGIAVASVAVLLPTMMALTRNPLSVSIAAGIAGAGVQMFGTIWETAVQSGVPTEQLSRVTSFDMLGSSVGVPLGEIVTGLLVGALGVHPALWLCAAVFIAPLTVAVLSRSVLGYRRPTNTAVAEPQFGESPA